MLSYLGIGTNLGDRANNLNRAVALLNEQAGTVLACSTYIKTAPWGFASENHFLNAVVAIDTPLPPHKLLEATQAIEKSLGRKHKTVNSNYTDRIIDIDILLYGELTIDTPELTIPHPLLLQRDFVYNLLLEIAPNIVHPIYHKNISELIYSGITQEEI